MVVHPSCKTLIPLAEADAENFLYGSSDHIQLQMLFPMMGSQAYLDWFKKDWKKD